MENVLFVIHTFLQAASIIAMLAMDVQTRVDDSRLTVLPYRFAFLNSLCERIIQCAVVNVVSESELKRIQVAAWTSRSPIRSPPVERV